MWKLAALMLLPIPGACKSEVQISNPLEWALSSDQPAIKRVMVHPRRYEVQVLYTRIDREEDSIRFTDFSFQVDDRNYFYPASSVKILTAALALEKLNEIDTLSRDSRFYVEGDSLENTFAGDILNIFTVSDNNANNRLFEFLGQDEINSRLRKKGVSPVRISHRLGIHSDDITTRPLVIYMNDSTTATSRPIISSEPIALTLPGIRKGHGYLSGDTLVREPFDFSPKNYYPVTAQHAVLKRLIFPEKFREEERFHLSPDQYRFLLETMQRLPRDAGFDPEVYYDGYCKFFIYGDTDDKIPPSVRIYNKVGFAYGTLTDCAYITDSAQQVEFLLTATILVNSNGIYNDDTYEYEEVGKPFLAALGRLLYSYEAQRKEHRD